MLSLVVLIKLLLVGLLLEKSFGNIEDEASKARIELQRRKSEKLKVCEGNFTLDSCSIHTDLHKNGPCKNGKTGALQIMNI
jgi:hypothetical protein